MSPWCSFGVVGPSQCLLPACRAVPANATATAKVTNVNAAITIKAGRVAVKGNAAKVSWAATPRVKTFGKKLTKTQSVASAQGYYKVNLENR